MLNYAHRGASDYAPENTISSFYMGLVLGANAIETDVRRCGSGELILFHDNTVERITDGTGLVCEKTLAELKQLKVFANATTKFYDRIPTYQEFLEIFSGYDIKFAIELKGPDVEDETYALSKQYGILHKTTFTSGSFERLKRMKELDPSVRIGWLVQDPQDEHLEKLLSIEGEEICPRACFTTEESVRKWRDLGLGVRVWYIENVRMMKEMCRLGVDGMTINYPDRLVSYLSTHRD